MASSTSTARGHRLWIPITIAALAALVIVATQLRPELERNAKAYTTLATVAVATLLILIWFLFLSRIRWSARLITVAALAVAIFGMTRVLRLDGAISGIGMPKFVWRWTPTRTLRFDPIDTKMATATTKTPIPRVADMTDVPQCFGPNRDGAIHGARLARDWNAAPPKQLWRQPIGSAWSAFAVVDGRAYTQEQRGEDEAVTCYEALTGRLLWTHTNKVRFFQWQGGEGPRGTPSVFQGRVFAYGATGILDCIDAQSGHLVWSHDVLKENHLENLMWGISASPLVFDDTVVVTGGLTAGPTLLAYDRTTGKLLWQAGKDMASYASPTVATLAGRRVILSVNAASLTIHDTSTGEVLLEWKSGRFGSGQTLVVDDLVIVQSETGPVYLASAKPEGYEELGQIPALSSKTWNHPTLAGRYLLVRNAQEAACYELPVQAPAAATAGR